MTGGKVEPTNRFAVIHGHFYQPPRENPWLGAIEPQADAAPAPNWNERIFDECYRPNAFSRLLDPDGTIRQIHNNYAVMSFNFGPTLLRWIEEKHPEVAQRIIEGDRESCLRLDGHGNAIAQVYNHIIMPLASRRDQLTQIRWGKKFFSSRFGRQPEGIWLAETAINMTTAQCLVEEEIRFTVLSPTQAEAFRPLDGSCDWQSADGNAFDTRRPYRLFVDGGHLDIFFFDSELSQAVSFGELLTNGDLLASAVSGRFDASLSWAQTVVIATDGETFGHHRAFGDMCLAFFFSEAAPKRNIACVNFGFILDRYPPRYEVRLRNAGGEGSAWSCSHGVGRWTRDCGCSTGGAANWRQQWRAPLRLALNTLQHRIDAAYEQRMLAMGMDPWHLRDAYGDILDRPKAEERLRDLCGGIVAADSEKRREVLRLLEAQKYMLFSFTSCGWFFADITGIETVQNLMYAYRAIQLGIAPDRQSELIADILPVLAQARSNVAGRNGQTIFEAIVRQYGRHAEIVAFTLAAERIICGKTQPVVSYFGYTAQFHSLERRMVDDAHWEVLRAVVQCPLAVDLSALTILVSYRTAIPISAWILPTAATLSAGFGLLDPTCWQTHPDVLKLDMSNLFDETRQRFAAILLQRISERNLRQVSWWLRENEPIVEVLAQLHLPLPPTLAGPISSVLNAEWKEQVALLASEAHHESAYAALLALRRKSVRWKVEIAIEESAPIIERLLLELLHRLGGNTGEAECMRIAFLLDIVDRLKIPVRKHIMEDLFYGTVYPTIVEQYERYRSASFPSAEETSLLVRMLTLARRMNFSVSRFPLTAKN